MSWSDIGLGSGQSAGVARGRIAVDVSGFTEARSIVVRSSREMSTAITDTDQKTKALANSTKNFGSVAGIAWGSFVVGGLKAADNVRNLDRLINTFVGDSRKAAQVMADLREQADRTNQPFLGLVNSARAVLPALRGSVDALDEATTIAQKLAILDPEQGFAGAGLAIREFLSGEYRSLVARFELSRDELKKIRDQYQGDTQGMLRALNAYLIETTNLTDEALAEMGDSGTVAFQAARDELILLLAEGFEPVLTEGVIPLLQGFNDLFREVRAGYPDLVKIAAIMATIAATGAVLGKGIPLLGVGGVSGAGQAGVLGAAAYGGSVLGVEATQGIGRATGDERLENYELGDAFDTAKQGLFLLANAFIEGHEVIFEGINLFVTSLERGGAEIEFVADTLYDAVDIAFDGIQDLVKLGFLSIQQFLANISIKDPSGKIIDIEFDELLGLDKNEIQRQLDELKLEDGSLSDFLSRMENNRDAYDDALAGIEESSRRRAEGIEDASRDLQIKIAQGLGVIEESEQVLVGFWKDLAENINRLTQAAQTPEDFSQEQIDAWIDFQEQIAEIEAEAAEARLEELEQQKKDELALLNKQNEEQAALLKKRNDSIKDAENKREKDETDSFNKMNERIADLRLKANRDEESAEIDRQNRLRKLQQELTDNLADAAANLSGRGVFDAFKQFNRGRRDTNDDAQIEKEARKRRLEQQIVDEQTAHETRLQNAQTAETERIAQVKAGYIEEYNALLLKQEQERDALEVAQQERLAQITAQAEKEKAAQEKAFIKTFNALAVEAGQHQNRMINIQRQGQQLAEVELRNWWTRQQQIFRNTTVTNSQVVPGRMGGPQNPFAPSGRTGSRALGGDIGLTGDYLMHAGEYALTPQETNFFKRVLGGDISIPRLQNAMSGGGGVQIGTFSPNYNFPKDAGQWDENKMMGFVTDVTLQTIDDVFKGYAGKG